MKPQSPRPLKRRELLQVGALACSSMGLANFLQWQAEATAAEAGRRRRSVIMIHLLGGPSHIDVYELPRYDHAIAALVSDLADRGRLDETAIVVWGEFGRQPKVGNVTPDGRGHWPAAGFALLAGGGLKTGQVVGSTDRLGERATGRPFSPSNVLSTLYHVLGINPARTLPDHAGRPQYLLEDREPIHQLL